MKVVTIGGMEAYTGFAQVYDLFMDNVPYEQWADFIDEKFKKYNIQDDLILDLGCGTGKLTRLMADKGYTLIGVDNAYEMLDIARERDDNILYVMQDMVELDLYSQVAGVYCACDCLNYILEKEDLLSVFNRVNEFLLDDGIFIFDINSQYKYEKLLAENTFAEVREESSFIWENYYDKEERINQYDLTLFVRTDEHNDTFSRFSEIHYQKCYELEEILDLLNEAGFDIKEILDCYSQEAAKSNSEKITIIASKKMK